MSEIVRLVAGADDYPPALNDLTDRPPFVDVCGRWPIDAPSVALVGARRASQEGLAFARTLGRVAAQAGIWVISGGAIGIDAAAHQGAVDAGGPTLAVLGTPLRRPGPVTNRGLFQAILDHGGGWMSEQSARPHRSAFRERNRLIAALADWVVVVEGQAKSGTRHTLSAAHRLRRPMGAVTWAPDDPRGAQAAWVYSNDGVPIDSAQAFLRCLGFPHRLATDGSPLETRPARSVEAIAASWGVSVSDALARLTEFELEGRALNAGGGLFRL